MWHFASIEFAYQTMSRSLSVLINCVIPCRVLAVVCVKTTGQAEPDLPCLQLQGKLTGNFERKNAKWCYDR